MSGASSPFVGELVYPGATGVKHADVRQYLIAKLKEPKVKN